MLPVLALAVALRAIGAIDLSLWQSIGLLLATLAAAGLALHGRLAADRPSPVYLTSYSLHVALGGALGGILTGIVAPLVFRVPVEGLLVIAAAVVMVAGRRLAPVVASIPPLVGGSRGGGVEPDRLDPTRSALTGASMASIASTSRRPGLHVLVSGTTIHGRETFDGPLAGEPLSYYHRAGPLGEVIESMQAERPAMRFGAVGLGAGRDRRVRPTGDTYRIAEIDPTVVEIARDPASFTFLADSAATIDVVVGDGRLDLETVAPDRSTCSCSTPSRRTPCRSTC